MANARVQEDMEVEENPGESPKINDLNIVINGKNNEYMIIIIFRVISQKNCEIWIFQPIQKSQFKSDLKELNFGHCHHLHDGCCYLKVSIIHSHGLYNAFPFQVNGCRDI